MISTGELAPVEHTPFDFRTPARIGERIDHPNEQLRLAAGYDHTFVLDPRADPRTPAGTVFEPQSGRLLEFWTTEPGVQLYTGNFLSGTDVGKSGVAYGRRSGFCLETQHFPDSPNQPPFPSTILRPGTEMRSTKAYRLSTR
jgi:aldose 1-epimerase